MPTSSFCSVSTPSVNSCSTIDQCSTIFAGGPWSPWNLKGDVAVRGNRVELARRLRNQIAGAAFITAILSPVIFLWMAANILFSNVAVSIHPRMCTLKISQLPALLAHKKGAQHSRCPYVDKLWASFTAPLQRTRTRVARSTYTCLRLLGEVHELLFLPDWRCDIKVSCFAVSIRMECTLFTQQEYFVRLRRIHCGHSAAWYL